MQPSLKTLFIIELSISVPISLGVVDEFEPVSGCGGMDHAHETGGELIVSGCDGAVDFHPAEHALDTVALLIERPVIPDRHPAI